MEDQEVKISHTCPWCNQSSTDPRSWLRVRSRVFHFCQPCSSQVRNSLGLLQILAREVGIKLGIRRA
jgi:hypothetical protein